MHKQQSLTLLDTEIDWKAYMEQVQQVLAGERNYALIKGGTGPLWFDPYFPLTVVIQLDMYGYTLPYIKSQMEVKIFSLHKLCLWHFIY
jgi:hypothetical protein